jgi:hypothetical protein
LSAIQGCKEHQKPPSVLPEGAFSFLRSIFSVIHEHDQTDLMKAKDMSANYIVAIAQVGAAARHADGAARADTSVAARDARRQP